MSAKSRILGVLILLPLPALAAPPGPVAGVEEVIFAVRAAGRDGHWYANFGYWSTDATRPLYGPDGGKLCKLNLRTGKVTVLLDDPGGAVRDPHVHCNGGRIVFSYRKAGSPYYHLYEIGADPSTKLGASGRGLRQLTDGPWDDIEPIYVPTATGGEDILFCSSRCKRWVPCYETQVAILHRCGPDGSNIRAVSANVEHDNTPWMLPDGRVLFTRWEYVDRSELCFHHLWTINPDGTGQMVYYGNMHPGTVMIDAKPIGSGGRIVCVISPGHGKREHAGRVAIVDARSGPDEQAAVTFLTRGNDWRDPYPVSETEFLVARENRLLLVRADGKTRVLHTIRGKDMLLHEPRPLRARPRERLVPPRTNWTKATGELLVTDVHRGRSMAGVRPGEIKKLLVLEVLPKPVGFGGVPHALSWWGTLNLERVVGTVPVERDGSAYMTLPAMRALFFVALDANDLAVKRMQSFVSVMPGESTGCAGCHEQRTRTPRPRRDVVAARRPPSRIEPIPDVPDVLDFPRDIQPILDRHCVSCHHGPTRRGGLELGGGRGPIYSHSFWTLLVRGQVADGQNGLGNRPPRTIGSSASELMHRALRRRGKARLSPRELKTLRLWLDSGASYAGTYAALRSGNLYDGPIFLRFTMAERFRKLFARRCDACHTGALRLQPKHPQGQHHIRTVPEGHPMIRFSEHLIYDFTRPEDSLVLRAPLAKTAGGYGLCRTVSRSGRLGQPANVFPDTRDPTYRALLAAVRDGKKALDAMTRFDMPNFHPTPPYVREMKRFGILLPGLDPARDRIDPYETDRAYWRSLWYRPDVGGRGETAAEARRGLRP